jgi:hypothetical protein
MPNDSSYPQKTHLADFYALAKFFCQELSGTWIRLDLQNTSPPHHGHAHFDLPLAAATWSKDDSDTNEGPNDFRVVLYVGFNAGHDKTLGSAVALSRDIR